MRRCTVEEARAHLPRVGGLVVGGPDLPWWHRPEGGYAGRRPLGTNG